MNYFDFSDAIRFRESTDNYTAINQFVEKRGQIYFLDLFFIMRK